MIGIGLFRSQLQIQFSVLRSGILPGNILLHIADDHLVIVFAVLEVKRLGSVDRIQQQACIVAVEREAVSGILIHVVRFDRVLETAGLSNDRKRALTHGDQLCESARFE